MAAPTVYRWDDAEAPVARGQRDSLVHILRACLVDGYGTKSAAGWTLEHINVDEDKAAFRNSQITGTGFYLQVDGKNGVNAHTPKVQGYEAMVSEDVGYFPFNPTSQTYATSKTDGTTARPWVLIADDRAFYLICWAGDTATPIAANNQCATMFFGDFISRYTDDVFVCALVSNGSPLGNYGYVNPSDKAFGLLGSTGIAIPRNSTGDIVNTICLLIQGGGPGTTGASSPGGLRGLAYTPGDPIIITRPHINEAATHTFRGWLPGLHYPCHPQSFDQLETVTAGDSPDEKTFLSFRHYVGQNNLGNIFISLDDWRG